MHCHSVYMCVFMSLPKLCVYLFMCVYLCVLCACVCLCVRVSVCVCGGGLPIEKR